VNAAGVGGGSGGAAGSGKGSGSGGAAEPCGSASPGNGAGSGGERPGGGSTGAAASGGVPGPGGAMGSGNGADSGGVPGSGGTASPGGDARSGGRGAPEASVVVIAKDNATVLRGLVASLGRQRGADGRFEIVVVDDGSDEPLPRAQLAALAGCVPFTLVRREGDGNRARARNEGAAAARGERLLFADADQQAPPGWVAEHLRYQREFGRALVIGHRRHRTDAGGDPVDWRPEVRSRVTGVFSENYTRVRAGWYLAFGCNFSVPAALYHRLGGFDEGYAGWGFEDSDFGYRAWAAGAVAVHNPYAWTWDFHHVVRTDAARVDEWEANRRRFLGRHPEAEAQAVRLIDNYPAGKRSSPGQEWLESFLAFDTELCGLAGVTPPAPAPPARWLTVLGPPDAEHARKLIASGGPVRIADGLRGSGLDLEVQLRGHRHVEYHALLD
jgi:glycosyltransferase involved in cell wall biosynthesis